MHSGGTIWVIYDHLFCFHILNTSIFIGLIDIMKFEIDLIFWLRELVRRILPFIVLFVLFFLLILDNFIAIVEV